MKRRTDITVENMFTKNQLRYGSESWKYKNHTYIYDNKNYSCLYGGWDTLT